MHDMNQVPLKVGDRIQTKRNGVVEIKRMVSSDIALCEMQNGVKVSIAITHAEAVFVPPTSYNGVGRGR